MTNSRGSSVAQRLKLVIVVLVASNLITAGLSVQFIRQLDARYSALIDLGVPVVDQLRMIRNDTVDVFRLSKQVVAARTTEVRAAQTSRMEAALQRLTGRSADLQPALASLTTAPVGEKLRDAVGRFDGDAKQLAGIAARENPTGAAQFRRTAFLGSFRTLMGTLDTLANESVREIQNQNDRNTAITGHHGKLLLGLGGWPVVLLALFALLLTVVLIFAWRLTVRVEPDFE